MQTNFRRLIIIAIVVFFASCSKTNNEGKLIPNNATMVLHINGKSLAAKLPWNEVKLNPFFKTIYTDSTLSARIKLIFNNPDSTGIDVGNDLLFFTQKDSTESYVAFEGTIKNEELFKKFTAQFLENGLKSEANGVKFISKPPYCVGYTKDKFVYVFDAPQMANSDALLKRMQQDSIAVATPISTDVSAACKAIFSLKENNSLAKDDKFSHLLKEEGDLHFWINIEQLSQGISANKMMAMVNVDKFYKDNTMTATANFENGKIKIATNNYVGDELSNIYKKYSGGKVNEDMLKHMPGKDIVGVMAISFKPEVIREILKMMNLDGLANMGLTQLGFTMDDFIKANKGDVLFGISDIALRTDTVHKNDEHEILAFRGAPKFNFVFATSVNDKDAFNKLINAGKKLSAKQGGDSAKLPFAYEYNGTYFALANNKENAGKFVTGSGTDFDFINKINGEAFGGYLNIQLLMKTFEKETLKDSSAKKLYDASVKLWDYATIKGGNMKDGAITQNIEIALLDKTTNSLKQLNQYASTISEVMQEKKDQEKGRPKEIIDTVSHQIKKPKLLKTK